MTTHSDQAGTRWDGVGYGARLAGFLGLAPFGLALAGRWQWSLSTIVGSTLPSVVGALAVLLGGERGLALLIAGFGLFWLFEHRTHAEHLPGDYLALRRALTLGVCTLLVLVAFASAEATAGSIQ